MSSCIGMLALETKKLTSLWKPKRLDGSGLESPAGKARWRELILWSAGWKMEKLSSRSVDDSYGEQGEAVSFKKAQVKNKCINYYLELSLALLCKNSTSKWAHKYCKATRWSLPQICFAMINWRILQCQVIWPSTVWGITQCQIVPGILTKTFCWEGTGRILKSVSYFRPKSVYWLPISVRSGLKFYTVLIYNHTHSEPYPLGPDIPIQPI